MRARWSGIWLGLVACSPDMPRGIAASAERGNVLVIVLDDVGPDKVGVFDGRRYGPPTPRLDALGLSGVRFSRAYAHPVCSPTRASLLTGRHPRRHGVGQALGANTGVGLSPDEVSLPQLLDVGTDGAYEHAAVGKWHLGSSAWGGASHPNEVGFGSFVGGLYNLSGELSDGSVEDYARWLETRDGETSEVTGYLTSATTDYALDAIEAMEEPWFLYVAFHASHSPLHVPPRELHAGDGLTDQSAPRELYDAMVEALDHEIGRLLDGMEPDVLSSTTIMVMGDNGTPAHAIVHPDYERDRGKGTVFEGGTRVPLMVSGHRVSGAGRVVDGLVMVEDIFPTVADLAGVAVQDHGLLLDGVSLLPSLGSRRSPTQRSVGYVEKFDLDPDGTVSRHSRAVFSDRYKLVRQERREDRFYVRTERGLDGEPVSLNELDVSDQHEFQGLTTWLDSFEASVPVSSKALAP